MYPTTEALPRFVERQDEPEEGLTPFTLAMLERVLEAQQDLTAVERFARAHDDGMLAADEARYRTLLPTSRPEAGQQYAFEVDLDLCTGCKSCVVACHSQNGLDDGESFRGVGLLDGGSSEAPYQQTVTSACHHCADPACMSGCPVLAYEKDAETGIVHHLDDQCIGCQYCVLACPYEVPRFHADKGIVRKCDMCRGRLEVGEAPACAAACPHGAIAIRVVDVARIVEASEVTSLVPGAPPSSHTLPTTTYKSSKPIPANALPADHHATRPAKDHLPLVVMLVLTQLSVGAFTAQAMLEERLAGPARAAFGALHGPFALFVGLFSLAASVAHLGRPRFAYRAVLGLRRSWLSREILAFGLFAGVAMLQAAVSTPSIATRLPAWLSALREPLLPAVCVLGAVGIACSAMLYHVTRRTFWHVASSGPKFFGTAVLLGGASTISMLVLAAYVRELDAPFAVARALLPYVAGCALTKLALELTVFLHLRDRTRSDLRRTATLLTGQLAGPFMLRVSLLLLGAVFVPAIFAHDGPVTAATVVGTLVALGCLVGGEMLERSLFFRAESGPRMPGAIA